MDIIVLDQMCLNQERCSIVLILGATVLRARQLRASETSLRSHSSALGWRLGGSLLFFGVTTLTDRHVWGVSHWSTCLVKRNL